jgi:response regulator NasT
MILPLRIAIADDERAISDYMHEILLEMNHQVAGVAQTGANLVELCRSARPDLVITDIKLPDMDGIAAAIQIYQENPVPIILVTAFHDSEYIERALDDHVMAYLIKPVMREDLEPAIALAMRRFEQFQALHKEAADLRQALEDRKKIERAKGLLMKQTGLDEEGAFRRLQSLARNQNRRTVEIAERILSLEAAFQPPPPG